MTETPTRTGKQEIKTQTVTVAREREVKANEPVTIREVFDLPKAGDKDAQPNRWQVVEERIKKEVKDVKFPAALHDLGPKICELFNVPLPDVMVTSWKKVGGLQELLEKSRKSPDEVMYLELAQHSINSEHKPHLEMRIKDLPVKKIEFLVKLVFNLKGFVLKVKAGAIQEIQTGACEVKGTLSYAGQVIVEKKLTPIKLPGTISVPAALGLFQRQSPPQAKTATAT
jgi:phosphoenolpyruvate synthase/pyruvate phosphate dikinase